MHRATLVGLFRLIRFELPFTAGVCALLGELLTLGRIPSAAKATFGFLGIFCLLATALILNDYFDIETDRINDIRRIYRSGLAVFLIFIIIRLTVG